MYSLISLQHETHDETHTESMHFMIVKFSLWAVDPKIP